MRRALAVLALVACNVPLVHFTGTGDGGGSGTDARPADAAAPGSYIWLRSLSQLATQRITSGPAGIFTPSYLYATANVGGMMFTSAGLADMVLLGWAEADGSNLFATHHGNVGSEFALLGLFTQNGTPIASGVSYGDVDLGQGEVMGGSGSATTFADGFIGAYGGGQASWVQRIVGPGDDKILATTRGPSSTIYGAGWFEQTTTFNGSTMTSAGLRDVFVARFNEFGGAIDLVRQFGGTGRDEVSGGGAASSDTTSFVLSGFFDDTIAFGGTAQALTASQGGLDMWIAKLDSNGNGIWAVTYGGPGDDRDESVAMDAAGDIYVTGTFTTSIQLGAFPLTSVGGSDHFIAKLSGADGSVVWATSFGSVNNDNAGAIAVDGAGHVAWAGCVDGALDGGATLGGFDGVIAEYGASDGSMLWRHVYSTSGDDCGGGVTYGATGDLLAVVNLGGPFDFGQPVAGDPNPIGVLMRIAP